MRSAEKHIYFIKPVGAVGPIKIGCSRFVENRLVQLMRWSPVPLEIIYSERGEHKLERKLHRCFADLHSHREWFHPGDRLLHAISRLFAGKTISEAVDLSDERGSIHAASPKRTRKAEAAS